MGKNGLQRIKKVGCVVLDFYNKKMLWSYWTFVFSKGNWKGRQRVFKFDIWITSRVAAEICSYNSYIDFFGQRFNILYPSSFTAQKNYRKTNFSIFVKNIYRFMNNVLLGTQSNWSPMVSKSQIPTTIIATSQ